jgi:hypothetical protein
VGGPVTGTIGFSVTNNTATGELVITVTHATRWAKKDGATKGPTGKTYTVNGASVKFDGGITSIANGDQVQLIGKFPVVRSHGKNACTPPAGRAATFRTVVVHPAAS